MTHQPRTPSRRQQPARAYVLLAAALMALSAPHVAAQHAPLLCSSEVRRQRALCARCPPRCSAASPALPLHPTAAALLPRAQRPQLVASVAAAAAAPPRPLSSQPQPLASQTIAIWLPAWLAVALTVFLAAFGGLFGLVLLALLPTLREVTLSARAVRTACSGVVEACDEVEKLAVLMQEDIKRVEAGFAAPLETLSKVAGNLRVPGEQALQDIIDDPDTQLLRSVAGSTERTIRERMGKWLRSLDAMRLRLQGDDGPSRRRLAPKRIAPAKASGIASAAPPQRSAAGTTGAERAAVEAWAGAATAVAAAESATARLEQALDTCQMEGACADEAALVQAARNAADEPAAAQTRAQATRADT